MFVKTHPIPKERTLSKQTGDKIKKSAVTSIVGQGPILLVAEHAGNLVPEFWENLGLPALYFDTHFGVDLGIDKLTREMSKRLNMPAVLANYSRLFLDYNRSSSAWDYCRPDLAGIPIPGNLMLEAADIEIRNNVAAIPLYEAIEQRFVGNEALIGLHSFTPFIHGAERQVDIGTIWRAQTPFVSLVSQLLEKFGSSAGLRIGHNEPYEWHDEANNSLLVHGINKGRVCIYLEINNSHLLDESRYLIIVSVLSKVFQAINAEISQKTL